MNPRICWHRIKAKNHAFLHVARLGMHEKGRHENLARYLNVRTQTSTRICPGKESVLSRTAKRSDRQNVYSFSDSLCYFPPAPRGGAPERQGKLLDMAQRCIGSPPWIPIAKVFTPVPYEPLFCQILPPAWDPEYPNHRTGKASRTLYIWIWHNFFGHNQA